MKRMVFALLLLAGCTAPRAQAYLDACIESRHQAISAERSLLKATDEWQSLNDQQKSSIHRAYAHAQRSATADCQMQANEVNALAWQQFNQSIQGGSRTMILGGAVSRDYPTCMVIGNTITCR